MPKAMFKEQTLKQNMKKIYWPAIDLTSCSFENGQKNEFTTTPANAQL